MNFINTNAFNPMYKGRLETDAMFEMAHFSFDYSGEYDRAAKFVEAHQSKNTKLWKTFVEQFRFPTDADDGGWSLLDI